ncbi:hypothetical protein D9758_009823 [Tetrapyrgos nigripes]|uniref:Uncharacterized protein n=1 Tax=Tetrapyrgos nigripes TaxID=182062 RepID=A0A8H5GN23_9AGAR|nr:hypothetical protein D9758_009823 [Tetrapyrgos nigripes]
MTSPLKMLLFTNAEHGQANVFLAVAYELVLRNVDVHLASFPPLQKRLTQLGQRLPEFEKVTFHPIAGASVEDAFGRMGRISVTELYHPPGVRGALQSYRYLENLLFPWTAEEYHQQLLVIQGIVERVSPGMVILESSFKGPFDVCKKLGQRCVVLTPNSPKDFFGMTQPFLKGFWKYPVSSSGFPYPVPFTRIPANIYLNLRLILQYVTSSTVKSYNKMRKDVHGLTQALIGQPSRDIPFIFPAFPETEFPGFVFPPNVLLCGPIVLPSAPVEVCDPETSRWLNRPGMKTVLVNLGSHVLSNIEHIRELGGGLRILLSKFNDVQVLWKVMEDGEIQDVLAQVVDPEKIKIVSWLEAEPGAILRHPNVICSVHHGGANSFFEAVSAGVPQVVLPIWYDTYDYARRAEYFGIGVYGNVKSAPGADAEEFGHALIKVIGVKEFTVKAKELAEGHSDEEGRKQAVQKILGFMS